MGQVGGHLQAGSAHTVVFTCVARFVPVSHIGYTNPGVTALRQFWNRSRHSVKQFAKAIIRQMVFRAPWGVREEILDACIDRIGLSEIGPRFFPKLSITEVGVPGDRGVVTSVWSDTAVLREYARNGTYAETVTSELLNFFGTGGGTFIDVGANIGLMTIPIARNPQVQCFAFEPEPVNFEFLKRNVARNAPGGSVEFRQAAVFRTTGTVSLAVADRNIGDHRLTLGFVPGRRTVEVPAIHLDAYLDRVTDPLAVKIDTQGAEPFVIVGGGEVLARAGLLAMEFCPYLMHQLGADPNIVIDLMARFDRVAVIRDDKADVPNFIPPAEAQSILRHNLGTAAASDADYLDILAMRGAHMMRCGPALIMH